MFSRFFKAYEKVKRRTFEITELAASEDRLSRSFDLFILTLILLNVVEHIISTVPGIYKQYDTYFEIFETFSLYVFAAEYIVRFWSCAASPKFKGRLKWMFRWGQIIDLIVILPLFLPMFVSDSRVLRIIRLFRFFRLLRLSKYSETIFAFKTILKARKEQLIMSFFGIVSLIVIGATVVYYAEHDAQPDAFSSIPEAIWWAVVTISTVGYGDISPITMPGKIFTIIFTIIGIGLFAVPTGIIASAIIRDDEESKEKENPVKKSGFRHYGKKRPRKHHKRFRIRP